MKKAILIFISFFCLSTLAGCNTIAGAGEDIKAGGEAITNTADSVKKSL